MVVSFVGSIQGDLQNLMVTRGSKTEATASERAEPETSSMLPVKPTLLLMDDRGILPSPFEQVNKKPKEEAVSQSTI